ncbi:MAG: peptidase, partial [Planctomycetota bacterium]
TEASATGPVSADAEELLPGWQRVSIGDIGTAAGPLRPGGKMNLDEFQVDVVTEGDFVDSGCEVKVVGKQGTRVVVRAV